MTYIGKQEMHVYVASALATLAGTDISSLCESRGPNNDDRFTLTNVPERVSLPEITRYIAEYRQLHASPLNGARPQVDTHTAKLHSGGRVQATQATVKITRHGHRVFVDIENY